MVLGGVTLGMLSSYTVLCGKLLFSCVMMQGSLYAHVLYCVCSPDAHANNARDGGRLPETQAGDVAGGTPAPLHAAALTGPPVFQVCHLPQFTIITKEARV